MRIYSLLLAAFLVSACNLIGATTTANATPSGMVTTDSPLTTETNPTSEPTEQQTQSPTATSNATPYTATPVDTLTPNPTSSAIPLDYPSPDGSYLAVLKKGGQRVVITAKDGQVGEIVWMKWIKVVGWTGDSRYFIINIHDQYGNQIAGGFDTLQWKQIPIGLSQTCYLGDRDGKCKRGVVSISADSQSVTLEDGTTVNLAELPE